MRICGKFISVRKNTKYTLEDYQQCYAEEGHTGRCNEYPYLWHLDQVAPRVRNKIIRDATMTTGASWKSEDAGPNRIKRWVMLLSDDELAQLGLNMSALKPGIVAKLRDKAATYTDCMSSAQYLTFLVYGMQNAPDPDDYTRQYLQKQFGSIKQGMTNCLICKSPLNFLDFEAARRGSALIETAHAQPRLHTPGNIGFAHRDCNIAQGNRSLPEFYGWMDSILSRTRTGL